MKPFVAGLRLLFWRMTVHKTLQNTIGGYRHVFMQL